MKARTPRGEPSEKDALVPVPRHKGLASGDQVWITVHRPGFENRPAVTMTDPEGEAVSDDRARRRRYEKRPELDRPGGRQGADRDDRGRTRDNHADDRDAFRKRQEKHRRIGEIRMRCDERGDGGESVRNHPDSACDMPGIIVNSTEPVRRQLLSRFLENNRPAPCCGPSAGRLAADGFSEPTYGRFSPVIIARTRFSPCSKLARMTPATWTKTRATSV